MSESCRAGASSPPAEALPPAPSIVWMMTASFSRTAARLGSKLALPISSGRLHVLVVNELAPITLLRKRLLFAHVHAIHVLAAILVVVRLILRNGAPWLA